MNSKYNRLSDSDDNHDVRLDTDENSDDQAVGDLMNYSMPSTNGSMPSKNIQVLPATGYIDQNSDSSVNTSGLSFPNEPPGLVRMSSTASIGSRAMEFVASKLAAGSVKGSIFTMCILIVGAGCLALPYAVRNVGLILGMTLVLLCPCTALFTLDLLLISAEYLPAELRGTGKNRNISYQSLALHSYGPGLSKALQILMAIQYFGSEVGYVVAFAGFFDLVYSIYDHPQGWPDSIYTICVIGICYGVIFPLSLLRNMNSLRFTSVLGFSMSIYLVSVVTVEYFMLCSDHTVDQHYSRATCVWSDNFHAPDYMLWPFSTFKDFYSGFLTAFPLIIFSYTGHQFLLPLYVELARPSIRRMRKVFRRGFGIVTVLYIFISLFGFLLFLDNVCSNLLLNDFRKRFDVVLAAMGIAISCILTEPIFSYNFRRMIGLLVWNQTTNQISTKWHVIITFLFVSANVALGVAVKSIAVVFGFLGSTTYPTFGYILPAMFFCKITPPGMYRTRKIISVIIAVVIGLISVLSLIFKIFNPGDEECAAKQSIG